MHVELTPELEQLVNAKVESGRYSSASEVVQDALRHLDQRDELRQSKLAEFHARLDRSSAEADRGELYDGEAYMKELLESLDVEEPDRRAG